jgi:quercetin dioxygenase-like cupin family protein
MKMREVRRIVAGHDGAGRSVILADAAAAPLRVAPGIEVAELWQSKGVRVKLGDANLSPPLSVVFPAPGETAFRIIEFGNSDGTSSPAGDDQAALAKLLGREGAVKGHLHRSQTLDYFVVLKGELHLVMERGEVKLLKNDTAVLLSGNHAWQNRGQEPAELFVAMIGAANCGDTHPTSKLPASVLPQAAQDRQLAQWSMHNVRRVVGGHDASGVATILYDGYIHQPNIRGGVLGLNALWEEESDQPDSHAVRDKANLAFPVPPDGTGSCLWLVEVQSMLQGDLAKMEAVIQEQVEQRTDVRSGALRVKDGLHGSDTLTYTLILKGEITYITEGDDIVVGEGDAIIQLGNAHSWRNTSGASVLLAVVHAAADPLGR